MPIATDMAAKFPTTPIANIERVANIWQNLGERQICPPEMVVSGD